MDGLQRLMDSIQFIEERLDSELSMDDIAEAAATSKFYFQRLFHMVTGVTVAEYIRKRRLTLAAQELAFHNQKVIDIALKYGYETPEAFSKAFKKAHGISPSEARSSGSTLKAYPKLSFQIQLKGVEEMNYKILEKPSFQVVGQGITVSMENGENLKRIPQFWDEVNTNGFTDHLSAYAGDLGVVGVCTDFNSDSNEFVYFIGIEKPSEPIDLENIEEIEIPSQTWAVFESIGAMPHAIQQVWDRVFTEWFPSTGYKPAEGPQLESYPEGDVTSTAYHSEVWIPIVSK